MEKKGFSENYASVYVTELTNSTVEYLQKFIVGKISDKDLFSECKYTNNSKKWFNKKYYRFN